jgi:hypothetical protein
VASAATAPYYITLGKLELETSGGGWVDIIEPDHRVDLMTTDASIVFFNNGRVPAAEYENFRVTFDDQGRKHQLTREEKFLPPVTVKKGSFVRVVFALEFEKDGTGAPVRPTGVRQWSLTVDDDERTDPGDKIEMKG